MTKGKENRRILFDSNGRLAAVLRRRAKFGPNAFLFGTEDGDYLASFTTAWGWLLLIADGHGTNVTRGPSTLDDGEHRCRIKPARDR
jgi:hypothetical protein